MDLKIVVVALLLLGCVSAKRRHRRSEPENLYPKRLQLAYGALGQCIVFDSMVRNTEIKNLAPRCIEGSPLQSLLPAIYAGMAIQPTQCLDEVQDELRQSPGWERLERLMTRFMSNKARGKSFCRFLETVLYPMKCAIETRCSNEKDKQVLEAVIATFYSVQQFLNLGMDTDFGCKNSSTTINPELYKFGTKFDKNMNYLIDQFDCSVYASHEISTTTEPPEETTFLWVVEEDDDSDFSDFSDEEGDANPDLFA